MLEKLPEEPEKLYNACIEKYNEIMSLASSNIASDIETALRLMKESSSPLIKAKDISRCEDHLKMIHGAAVIQRMMWILLGVTILVSIVIMAFVL